MTEKMKIPNAQRRRKYQELQEQPEQQEEEVQEEQTEAVTETSSTLNHHIRKPAGPAKEEEVQHVEVQAPKRNSKLYKNRMKIYKFQKENKQIKEENSTTAHPTENQSYLKRAKTKGIEEVEYQHPEAGIILRSLVV